MNRPKCQICGFPLMLPVDYERQREPICCSEPMGWTKAATAEEFLCCECHSKEFDADWKSDQPCRRCKTRPCERGRDCWWNPPDRHCYEIYIACRYVPVLIGVNVFSSTSVYRAGIRAEHRRSLEVLS